MTVPDTTYRPIPASGSDNRRGSSWRRAAVVPLIFFIVGLSGTVTGTLLPELVSRFGVSESEVVALVALWNLGVIGGSVATNVIVRRFPPRSTLIVQGVAAAVSLAVMGLAGTYLLYLVAYGLLATTCGSLLTYGHTAAAQGSTTSVASSLSLAEFSIGIGYMSTPVVFYALNVLEVEWTIGLTALGLLPLLITVAAFAMPRQPIMTASPLDQDGESDGGESSSSRRYAMAALGGIVVCSVGIHFLEWGQNTWNVYYATEGLAIDGTSAKLAFSAFPAAMVVARLANVFVARLAPLSLLLISNLLLIGAGIGVIATASDFSSLGIGNILFGLGMGPLIPNTMALILENRLDLAASVSSSIIIGGGVGSFLSGYVLGLDIEAGNIEVLYSRSFLYVLVGLALSLLVLKNLLDNRRAVGPPFNQMET